jgi:hypothetical protein
MSYIVNKTNGAVLVTVLDGQVDDRVSSSIRLIGKQVINYGELQNENFVQLLENFSNSIDPIHPLQGQLWWNSTTKAMQVFDGTSWRPATGFTSANTAPLASYVGDQWYDTINQQFKVYNGTNWLVVGPAYSALDAVSGAVVAAVYDTGLTKHTIVKLYNQGNLVAIMSNSGAFTPNVAIPGFTAINPGIQFTTTIDAVKLYGTATNADKLGNLAVTQFVRSDADTISSGRLSIHNQLDVGASNELNVAVTTGNAVLTNTSSNKDLSLAVNVASVLTTALTVHGATGLITVAADPTAALGIATKQYADTITTTLRNDTSSEIASNVATLNGAIAGVQANVTAANAAITTLQTTYAPLANPTFTGSPLAPTAPPGTANTMVATTAFVSTLTSIFDATRIYNGTSSAKINSGNIVLTVSGTTVATALNTGISTITQAQNDNSTSIATTAYADRGDKNFVKNSTKYQPTCYVSNLAPDNLVGGDGDFWFQYL